MKHILGLLLILITACEHPKNNNEIPPLNTDSTRANTTVASVLKSIGDTVLKFSWRASQVAVYIKSSKKADSKGTILVLPGWNHSTQYWCNRMRFCDMATNAGYHLVMPEIQKGVYTQHPYPETRSDMLHAPTMVFIDSILIPECNRRFGILTSKGTNFVAGISTGARGAVLIAMNHPEIFKKGVAMSGDYDNSKLVTDKVMINYYGPWRNHSDRWLNDANPVKHIEKLSTPFLFIHAMHDEVVKPEHSIHFHEMLVRAGLIQHQLILEQGGGHTYAFWDRYTERILQHFDSN